MVVTANATVTGTAAQAPRSNAGTMSSGISGSHGPSTKMTNRLQAVSAAGDSFSRSPVAAVARLSPGVAVRVHHAAVVDVDVPLAAATARQRPAGVGEPEHDQEPRRDRAARRLDPLELTERDPQADAEHAEDDRRRDVADAAQRGDERRLPVRPALRATEHDERQRVIDPIRVCTKPMLTAEPIRMLELLHRPGIIVAAARPSKYRLRPGVAAPCRANGAMLGCAPLTQPSPAGAPRLRLSGLLAALAVGALVLLFPAPAGLTAAAWRMAALFAVALVLWATEAIPIAVTALLVLVLQPLLGIAELRPAFTASMSPVFFFVLAMFCISTAFPTSGLDRRFALTLLARAGADTRRILLAFMVGTAAISTIMSDVPACAIFMSIALGLFAANGIEPGKSRFGKAVMIGIPVASLIGGVATPAGSSINILGIEFIEKFGGVRVPFLDWMAIGVPMAVILTPIAWWVLARCYPPEKDAIRDVGALRREHAALGPLQDRGVEADRASSAPCWCCGSRARGSRRSTSRLVALCGSIAMFLPGIGMLEWKQVERGTGWDTLLMIAGVSSIGVASVETGLAKWIVERSMGGIEHWPALWIVAAISVFTVVVHLVLPIGPVINATLIPPIALLAKETGQNPVLYALAGRVHRVVRVPAAARPGAAPHLHARLLPHARHAAAGRDPLLIWVVLMTVLMLTVAPAIGLL